MMALRNSIVATKRVILKNVENILWMRRQPKSSFMHMDDGFGELFKIETVMRQWETIPLFVCGFIAAVLPVLHTTFLLMHAQDISLKPGTKMKNQTHCQVFEGKPKPTKYIVINQKWEWPKGLIEALKDDCASGKPKECRKKK